MVISAPQSPARSVRSVAFAESVSGNSHGSSSVHSFGSFRKKSGSSDVKKVINALNSAVSEQQRKEALKTAAKKFDHRDKAKHNYEIEIGAGEALYQKLCVAQAGVERGKDTSTELGLICKALEMVYRCSSATRAKSYEEIGHELTTTYIKIIERCEQGIIPKGDSIVNDILLVFQYFARVQSISIPLASQRNVLKTLGSLIGSTSTPNNTRATAMSTIADLACAEVNGNRMAKIPGLFGSIIEVAYLDSSGETRESAARAIQNIVFSLEDNVPSVKFEKLVKALSILMTDKHEKTRKYAAGALQNLTTWSDVQVRLVTFDGGAVVDSLVRLISTRDSEETRARAIGAIINLTSEDTTGTLCLHRSLLNYLGNCAISDKSAIVKKNAADALMWLAEDMKTPRNGQKELLDVLIKVAKVSSGKVKTSVAKALYELSKSKENRASMARHPGLLDALERMAKKNNSDSDTVAKDNSLQTLANLARRSGDSVY